MKLSIKWLAPIVLQILSLSSTALGSSAASLSNIGSVHLVLNVSLSLAASPIELLSDASQPRPLSLDGGTVINLTTQELSIPVMPLHLLGKKSWNVYNQDNIEKVKRDEAKAKAKEEADEERMQEIDAQRRMQILRGEPPISLLGNDVQDEDQNNQCERGTVREQRKRKRYGEDDTDFEMRVANERTQAVNSETQIVLRRPVDAPLVNRDGHIDLFPETPKTDAKSANAERELARKKKEYADQYTVKFSDAAGYNQGVKTPWYYKNSSTLDDDATPGKNVWGNKDPRRKEREAARIVSNDPLAMMRQGAAQVRKVEKERSAWNKEREREMTELKKAERKERKRRRRNRDADEDELENVQLDDSTSKHKGLSRYTKSEKDDEHHRPRGKDRHREGRRN